MKSFSEREGFKPIKTMMQLDDVDQDTRCGLWNVLNVVYWRMPDRRICHIEEDDDLYLLMIRMWFNHFKLPIDSMGIYFSEIYNFLKNNFFKGEWYEVYDFIEFVVNNYPDENGNLQKVFKELCNGILEKEMAGYRFVGDKITMITSENEIKEIEDASLVFG